MRNLVILALAALGAAPSFGAVVLFSDFGPPGNPYNAGGWVVRNNQEVALGFSVNAALPLLEIDVPVFFSSPQPSVLPSQPLLVELVGPYPTNQQTPAAPFNVIESWTINASGPPVTTTVHHLSSTLQPVLDPLQRYFVKMSSVGLSEPFQWAWNINNQGVNGFALTNSGTWVSSSLSAPAMEVLGVSGGQSTAPVPEPGTVGLIAAGLLGGMVFRHRARR